MIPGHSRANRNAIPGPDGRLSSWVAAAIARLIAPVARDERGATIVFVAVALVPLVAFVGLAVDTTRGYLAKSRLSSAVDAAALAGGRVFTSANRDADVQMYFEANFPDGYMGSTLQPLVITPNTVDKKLTVLAEATIPTSFLHLVGIDTIPLAASVEVAIESQNVEVALVLDVTGSMSGTKIADLISAANELVDIVVQDDQSLFFTKAALAPYSQAVNVGSYANQMRGTPPSPKAITNITKANPAVVTSANHGFNTGDKIFISGVGGLTTANNVMTAVATATSPNLWVVQKIDDNSFSLRRCNGDATSCSTTNAVNSSAWSGTYTADTGSIYCMTAGCTYLAFRRDSDNRWVTWSINNCVTERYAANVATDAAPSTTPVGPRYQPSGGSGNDCLTAEILPLTSDKTLLHARINALTAAGSTAGQIGIAWGWYLLSPTFTSAITGWPTAGQPSAYTTQNLMKVAILMTDGEFNTVYRNGVIAQDSGSGSGSDSYHINQDSHNGNPYTQAQNLCTGMKAAGIIVYTIGFDISESTAVTTLLSQCASGPSYAYLPESGTELQEAFTDIAQKISKLRLSK